MEDWVNTCGIYKILSPTGRIYIGQSENIKRRKREYSKLKNVQGQPRLYRSLLKHGWEAHTFEIIEECDIDDLNCRERHWQDHYDVLNRGLNCILTQCGEQRLEWSDEMRQARSGEGNPMFGYKWSDEQRAEISERMLGANNSNARRVLDVNTGIIYGSRSEACVALGVSKSSVNNYLRGKRVNKTTLIYLDDYEKGLTPSTLFTPKKRKSRPKKNKPPKIKKDNRIKVISVESKIVYESVAEAAMKYGISAAILSSYLKREITNPTDLMYLKEFENGMTLNKRVKRVFQQVLDTDTGVIYNSIKEASIQYGISLSTLNNYLSGKRLNKTTLIKIYE